MKINEIITENRKPTFKLNEVGMAHAEDIIFYEGSAGALRVINSFKHLPKTRDTGLTIKWDGCLHPDSIIQTDTGEKRIGDVITEFSPTVDSYVLAYDFEKNENVMTKILDAHQSVGVKAWIRIDLSNEDYILLTEDHPVFTTNRGWIAAGELTSDDDIKEP